MRWCAATRTGGLTRDDVGEPGTDILLHNLIVALVESTTLTNADLEAIDRLEGPAHLVAQRS